MSLDTLLDKKITIKAPTETRDAMNAIVRSWSTQFRNVPCRIVPLRGLELIEWNRESTKVTHKIYLRPLAGLTEAMCVVYDGRYFSIEMIRDAHELGRLMVLHCLERRGPSEAAVAAAEGGGFGVGGFGL